MFILELTRQPTPLGSVCRELNLVRERLKLLCLNRITGSMKGLALTDYEVGIVAAVNARLERFRRPYRVLALPPAVRQHHIDLRWGRIEGDAWVFESQSINLYPPSKRKPADDRDADHADAEPEVACASV